MSKGAVWAQGQRLLGSACRLQKEEQNHAKTISLSFKCPHPTSSPPSACIQRHTVISTSFLSCPAGPSCAPHSRPGQPRSGLGPLHHPRSGSQDLSSGRVGACGKEQSWVAVNSLQHKQPRCFTPSSTVYFKINSNKSCLIHSTIEACKTSNWWDSYSLAALTVV